MFSAWFAGIVHGVVVQMTAATGFGGRAARPNASASFGRSSSRSGKATSIARSTLSWYSTSASASAEPQSKHQFTGLRPRKTKPLAMIFASARISSASLRKFIVVYGRSHSPSTPRRLKSFFCRSICSVAHARDFAITSRAGRCLPYFFSIWISIGMPWQSQPGTYCASKPAIWRLLTTTSFRILLTAWPMWMSLFAYGGPSCRIHFRRPTEAARICW